MLQSWNKVTENDLCYLKESNKHFERPPVTKLHRRALEDEAACVDVKTNWDHRDHLDQSTPPSQTGTDTSCRRLEADGIAVVQQQ